MAGRPAPAVGGRHGALLVADGALRELLREGARGRRRGVLPPVAVRGAGASEAPGGSAGGSAGADPEAGRGDEERLRAERGQAPADGPAAGASAPAAAGGGGRPGVERAARPAAEGTGHGLPAGREAGRPRGAVRVGGRTGVGAAGAGRGARGGALGGQGRRRRGAPLPVVERGAAERRQRGPGGELPRIPGKEAERQGETLLVGHGPAGGQMERNGPDARRAGRAGGSRTKRSTP